MSPSSFSSASDHSPGGLHAWRFVVCLGAPWIDHEGANLTEEGRLFGMRGTAQEVGDLEIRDLTAGRRVRPMPDERQAGRGVTAEEPGIAVGAAVELLHPVLTGLRTKRGVLYSIRRNDEVSGLAQRSEDAGN
jgi:hypothetical protein